MEKMRYERPVMRAEMFQTNAFCAACGSEQHILDVDGINVGEADLYFNLGAGGSKGSDYTFTEDWEFLKTLTFTNDNRGTMTSLDSSTLGVQQYYWTAEYAGERYYLEYSVGNTASTGREVFVLYEESSTKNGFLQSNHENKLNINWLGYQGSDSDDDGGYYDNSLFGMFFKNRMIAKS